MKEELIKIGVIGLGNCGGQMADLAAAHGFGAAAMNASQKDLDLLKNDILLFPVGDGKGTGKSRENSKEFFIQRINMVQDSAFKEFVDNHDCIVIATSTGGGFGSGSSLVLREILGKLYPNKAIIVAGVLPFDDEGYTAQNHSIEWLQELTETEEGSATYMIYDNNIWANKPKQKVCELINNQFVSDLKVIRGDYINSTTTGGIDNRDMMTAISAPGRLFIDAIELLEEADIVDNSIIATIQEHIREHSAHAQLSDDKVISASAMMYTLREDFAPYTPNLKSELQEAFGVHLNDYDNFADVPMDFEEQDSVALLLCGLSQPTLRINRLINKRDKLEEDILGRKHAESKLAAASRNKDPRLGLSAKTFASASTGGASGNASDIINSFLKDK